MGVVLVIGGSAWAAERMGSDAHSPSSSATSPTSATITSDETPAAVVALVREWLDQPGNHLSGPVYWVETTAHRTALIGSGVGPGVPDVPTYAVVLRGQLSPPFAMSCPSYAPPAHACPKPTGTVALLIIPVKANAGVSGMNLDAANDYDLSVLGSVHTYHPQ